MTEALTQAFLTFLGEAATMITTMAIAQIGWYLAAGVVIGILLVALLSWGIVLSFRLLKWTATWCIRRIRRPAGRPSDPTSA